MLKGVPEECCSTQNAEYSNERKPLPSLTHRILSLPSKTLCTKILRTCSIRKEKKKRKKKSKFQDVVDGYFLSKASP